ncbi:putative necrosis-inducing factor domain-containing protein [Trichoderma austrokoningii]
MTQLVASITAAPAPKVGDKVAISADLDFDYHKLLEPAELEEALDRCDPKDIGFSRTSLNTTEASVLSTRTLQGFCGDSSFNCATSGGSPLIFDCFYIYNVGTCCFEATNHFTLATAYIGGLDIADITRDSINKAMFCPARIVPENCIMGSLLRTTWGIYHC